MTVRVTQIDPELDEQVKQRVPKTHRGDAPKWRVDYALRRFVELVDPLPSDNGPTHDPSAPGGTPVPQQEAAP